MNIVPRATLSTAAGLLGLAVVLGWASDRPSGFVVRHRQRRAEHGGGHGYFSDSTIVLARGAQPRGVRGDELAVALGYVERLRLGLGSPFRLADEALADPRLGRAMSPRVAWTMLGRLRRGDAYIVDPAVLDGAGPWGRDGHGATGDAHLALIERAIESASDPRAGEVSVRLAYTIEASKGSLAQTTPSIAIQVAALVRDRALARRDADALLSDAARDRTSALTLLRARRAAYAFDVERPSLAPLSDALQARGDERATAAASCAALDTLDRVVAAEHQRTISVRPRR